MKYIRKIVALLIGVMFFAALVISLGMIFAVKNINVTLITYADEETYAESYTQAKETLSVFKGESILFVSGDKVAQTVSDSNYVVTSCEKVFPCTLNVTLRERLETFAVAASELYWMYDNDGKFLRSGKENNNVNDGTPNIELIGVTVSQIENIASIATSFKNTFGCLRSIVSSIRLDVNPDIEGYTDKLIFNLRCGLEIQIDEYSEYTQDKLKAAYENYCTLTDREKLSGTIISLHIGGEEGVTYADYKPSKKSGS